MACKHKTWTAMDFSELDLTNHKVVLDIECDECSAQGQVTLTLAEAQAALLTWEEADEEEEEDEKEE